MIDSSLETALSEPADSDQVLELSKQFCFDAAHTLKREVDAEPSRRIHGHSFRAVVSVRGPRDPVSGMVVDLGILERSLVAARDALDHRLLDEVDGLGPATLENLAFWIWNLLAAAIDNLHEVAVYRDSSGECARYRGPCTR